jgi:hypothetical protein
MRALASDPKERYKTAQEADKALSDAWDKCLNEALVHPSALTATEQPHAKVHGPMHSGAKGAKSPPPTPSLDDAPTKRMVIESESDIGDDDPTRLVIRERTHPPAATTVGGGHSDSIIIDETAPEAEDDLIEIARATA